MRNLTKRRMCVFLLAGLILAPALSSAPDLKLGFQVSGGGAYLAGGDVNSVAAGYDLRTGEWGRLRLGGDFEAGILAVLSPKFRLCLASGITFGTLKSSEPYYGGIAERVNLETSIRAIPAKLNAYYVLLSRPKWSVEAMAGAGVYFAHWDDQRDIIARDNLGKNSLTAQASGQGIGFEGGLAFIYGLSNRLALVGEIFGRWARIIGFDGDSVWTWYDKSKTSTTGTLYYYEFEGDPGQWLPWTEIMDKTPREQWGSEVKNDRKAAISFSGFGLRIGIRFSLY